MVSTIGQCDMAVNALRVSELCNSYLPGRGDTMITKVVHPGRGSAIAHPVVLTLANSPNVGISTA